MIRAALGVDPHAGTILDDLRAKPSHIG